MSSLHLLHKLFGKKTPVINYKIIREIFSNRGHRFNMCGGDPIKESQVTATESILGSPDSVADFAVRFYHNENNETWIEEMLTARFLRTKMPLKYKCDEDIIKLVEEAISFRNEFMRECVTDAKEKSPNLFAP